MTFNGLTHADLQFIPAVSLGDDRAAITVEEALGTVAAAVFFGQSAHIEDKLAVHTSRGYGQTMPHACRLVLLLAPLPPQNFGWVLRCVAQSRLSPQPFG